MNKLWLITKIQFKEIFDFRKMMRQKKKAASFLAVLIGFLLMFGFISVVYNAMFAMMLYSNDMFENYLPLVFVVTSVVTLSTTMFKVKGVIFGSKDYDLLLNLPVPTSSVVLSKVIILYLYECLFTVLIMFPACVIHLIMVQDVVSFLLAMVSCLFIPLIPIALASIIGFVISLITEKIRFKSVLQIMLYIVFLGLIFSFSFMTSNPEQVSSAIGQLVNQMKNIYPIFDIYLKGIVDKNILYFVLFIAISLVIFVLFSYLIGLGYKRINQLIFSSRPHVKYVEKKLVVKSQFRALFAKERKKLFSSSAYLLNSASLAIMTIIIAILLVVLINGELGQSLEGSDIDFASIMKQYIFPYVGIGICFFLGMGTTTSASISLEGNHFWIIKSSPINLRSYFMSKIAVHIMVFVPCSIIAGLILIFGLKMDVVSAIFTIILPILFTSFTAITGLIINLYQPKMKWSNENAAVKNSASVLITMGFGVLITIIFSVVIGVISFLASPIVANIGLLFILLASIYASYKYMLRVGPRLMNRIS